MPGPLAALRLFNREGVAPLAIDANVQRAKSKGQSSEKLSVSSVAKKFGCGFAAMGFRWLKNDLKKDSQEIAL